MDPVELRTRDGRPRPAARRLAAVSVLVVLAVAGQVVTEAHPSRRAVQDGQEPDGPVVVLGHPVYIFEFSTSGFAPQSLRTGPGKSAIFIRNLTMFSQRFTVTRKRDGKRKLLFNGETIAGQSITGTTKFRIGDVYTVKETNSGLQTKITIE